MLDAQADGFSALSRRRKQRDGAVMSADFVHKALLTTVEGTGLEVSLGSRRRIGGEFWLQQAGGDGETGYWVRYKVSTDRDLPAGALLRVTYLYPSASWPDRRDGLSDTEVVLDLTLVGAKSGDARILAALAVTAVRCHQHDLTSRTACPEREEPEPCPG
jgi:hypothetical protein